MKKNKFNQFWKSWHFFCILTVFSYVSMRALTAFNHPIDIHLPSADEIRERTEFDISERREIELENGECVSVYES